MESKPEGVMQLFTWEPNQRAKCNFCGKSISRKTSMHPLRAHVRRHHPREIEGIELYAPSTTAIIIAEQGGVFDCDVSIVSLLQVQKMEEELKCKHCFCLFTDPLLLPCFHGLCSSCALDLTGTYSTPSTAVSSNSSASSTTSSSGGSGDSDHLDKLSISSETDSGVIVCSGSNPGATAATTSSTGSGSRPGSFAGTPLAQLPAAPPCVYQLTCPVCRKVCLFDEKGARNLPPYRIVQPIIDRLRLGAPRCQMCEKDPKPATVVCNQCEIRYCEPCRELCHPARGPLALHTLSKATPLPASGGGERPPIKESPCPDHQEMFQFYCCTCKIPACQLCINANRHGTHDVQSINTICKAQKTELSSNLQMLSEKARSTTEFIQRLKNMSDTVTESSAEYEGIINAQCDALIKAIEEKRIQLIESLRVQRETKIRRLKEEQLKCTGKLQQTTGLIHFCIEALKEVDSATFLQVGMNLINRVENADLTWRQEVTDAVPRVSPVIDFSLDDELVLKAIQSLSFGHAADGDECPILIVPVIVPEKCSAENNSVTVSWTVPNEEFVEGYVLEIDDGSGGDFREVYCGKEGICTVDGLHFNAIYKARVKAFNTYGEGDYSEIVCLETAEVAWFAFEPRLSGTELTFLNHNETVSADGWEHRVALGSVGFSRGVHYWEVKVDKYTPDTDPAFGVARIDVARDRMLGKDDRGYAMYVDYKRSWFQHNRQHERRTDGGIQSGSTVGVLLDLDRHSLHFLVDGKVQGNAIAFGDLYGVFYPAVSVNRGVTVTLRTSLQPPHLIDC